MPCREFSDLAELSMRFILMQEGNRDIPLDARSLTKGVFCISAMALVLILRVKVDVRSGSLVLCPCDQLDCENEVNWIRMCPMMTVAYKKFARSVLLTRSEPQFLCSFE